MSKIFTPVLHPRIEQRKRQGPVKVHDLMTKGDSPIARFNTWVAVKVTKSVGTMWCAYAFAALALVSLPAAIMSGNAVLIVSWISQSEEHTSELQSRVDLVCRLLLEKKKKK